MSVKFSDNLNDLASLALDSNARRSPVRRKSRVHPWDKIPDDARVPPWMETDRSPSPQNGRAIGA
jgi:hypothetical protein